MSGFCTKNSVYYVDTTKKTITGGIFGSYPCRYECLSAMIGTCAIIELGKGKVVKTSTITAYI